MSETTDARVAEIDQLTAERDKLQRFKDWTHDYLDRHGVPHHPPGTHGAEGCRIGDRMDWLMAKVARLQRIEKEAHRVVSVCTPFCEGDFYNLSAALAAAQQEDSK